MSDTPRYRIEKRGRYTSPGSIESVPILTRDGQEISERDLLCDIANMLDSLPREQLAPGAVLRRTRRQRIEQEIAAAESAAAWERACIAVGDYAKPPCAFYEMTREQREQRAQQETARADALRAELANLEGPADGG